MRRDEEGNLRAPVQQDFAIMWNRKLCSQFRKNKGFASVSWPFVSSVALVFLYWTRRDRIFKLPFHTTSTLAPRSPVSTTYMKLATSTLRALGMSTSPEHIFASRFQISSVFRYRQALSSIVDAVVWPTRACPSKLEGATLTISHHASVSRQGMAFRLRRNTHDKTYRHIILSSITAFLYQGT